MLFGKKINNNRKHFKGSSWRPTTHCALSSEVTKIPAKINNLEVLRPQAITMHGRRAVNSHLLFLPISQMSLDSLHHVSNRRRGQQRTVPSHLR